MSQSILVIEDMPRWQEQFRDILIGMELKLDIAAGIDEAKTYLEQTHYDLVLLDAALDQSNFTLECQQFLAFLHRQYQNLPVVAMTGKALEPDEVFTLSNLGIVDFIYKPKIQLPDFQRRILEAMQKLVYDQHSAGVGRPETEETAVDVVIITALQEELQAVLRHLGPADKISMMNRFYYKALLPLENEQRSYTVVAFSLSGMGNMQASVAATQAITAWNPSQLILTGITGGIKQGTDRFLGDLIVGEQIVSYEFGRVEEGETVRRFQVIRPAFPLVEAARNLSPDKWILSAKVSRPDGSSGRVVPKVHFGVVASGGKVVADATLIEELKSHWSELIGIEMEGYGTALAAYQAETAPGILMVKGISDWADNSKNDDWREYAADMAAAFVIALLRTTPFTSTVNRHQAVKLTPTGHSDESKS